MKYQASALAFVLAFGTARIEAAPPSIPSVAVEGVLQLGEFLGPPNFGANPDSDGIERSYFLQLPAQLITQLRTACSLLGFSQQSQTTFFVQLVVFEDEQSVAKALIGRRVRVVGTVFEPIILRRAPRQNRDRCSSMADAQIVTCSNWFGSGGCGWDLTNELSARFTQLGLMPVNAGDLVRLLALLTDDVVFLNPGQAPFGGDGFPGGFSAAHQQYRIRCISDLEEVVIVGEVAYTLSRDFFVAADLDLINLPEICRSGKIGA